MATPTVTNTFSNSTVADASEVNTNFSDIINALTDGTSDHSISTLTLASTFTANGNTTLGNAAGDTLTVNATPTFAAATTFSSTITVTGTATLNGDVALGSDSGDTVTVNGATDFGAVDVSFNTDTMYVDASAGQVGFGTTSPINVISAQTPNTTSQDVVAALDTSGDPMAALRVLSGNRGGFRLYDSEGTVTTFLDSSGDSYFNAGNVGINTDAPGTRLEVQDSSTSGGILKIDCSAGASNQEYITFEFGGSNTDNGGIRRQGTSQTPEFFAGSDRRIKKNIEPMPAVLDKIKAVVLSKYDLKSGGQSHGPIAQQLIDVFPDKVTTSDDGIGEDLPEGVSPWTVSRDFTFELMKAIQEQQAIIEKMQAEIDDLKK